MINFNEIIDSFNRIDLKDLNKSEMINFISSVYITRRKIFKFFDAVDVMDFGVLIESGTDGFWHLSEDNKKYFWSEFIDYLAAKGEDSEYCENKISDKVDIIRKEDFTLIISRMVHFNGSIDEVISATILDNDKEIKVLENV